MPAAALLFVTNISCAASAQFLERLFASYGDVQSIEIHEEAGQRYAEVGFGAVDDADSAIAALHYRYYTAPDLPLIVLYSKKSPNVTAYGRLVGQEYVSALSEGRSPKELPLDTFDAKYDRTQVVVPVCDTGEAVITATRTTPPASLYS